MQLHALSVFDLLKFTHLSLEPVVFLLLVVITECDGLGILLLLQLLKLFLELNFDLLVHLEHTIQAIDLLLVSFLDSLKLLCVLLPALAGALAGLGSHVGGLVL